MADNNKVLTDDDIIIDTESGFAVNIPAQQQKPHQWWLMFPGAYQDILKMRRLLGLTVVDDLDGKINEKNLDDLFGEEK